MAATPECPYGGNPRSWSAGVYPGGMKESEWPCGPPVVSGRAWPNPENLELTTKTIS